MYWIHFNVILQWPTPGTQSSKKECKFPESLGNKKEKKSVLNIIFYRCFSCENSPSSDSIFWLNWPWNLIRRDVSVRIDCDFFSREDLICQKERNRRVSSNEQEMQIWLNFILHLFAQISSFFSPLWSP
jgi:hypothetical protein